MNAVFFCASLDSCLLKDNVPGIYNSYPWSAEDEVVITTFRRRVAADILFAAT
jgi:hypothetical protein